MKTNKKAISLIVLVITIIVMVILAGAIILTLSNSGIFNKANNAVDEYNLKQVQTMAAVIWSEAYLDEDIVLNEEYIKGELKDQGVDVDKYNFILTERGIEVQLKDANISDYGIYFGRIYEMGEEGNKIGYVLHEDGSAEYYETINGILFCTAAYPKDSIKYEKGKITMEDITGLVSQDGMTISDESSMLSLKCNFTKINGINKNTKYSDSNETVSISMDDNNIGTMVFQGATQQSEVTITGADHILTVLGNTFYVSLDGKYIYWNDATLVLELEEETVVVGDWEVAWVYNNGAWSERIDKGGNATGDFVVKVYPLNKKVTPVAPSGNAAFETMISTLSLKENTAYKMVIEGNGDMPSLYTATYDEDDSLVSENSYAWQTESLLGMIIYDKYDTTGKFYTFYITDVEIGENITSLGEYSLSYMPSLKNVTISNNVVKIGSRAFSNSGLTKLKLPTNLVQIGDGAFSNSTITTINIPNSVTSIGEKAFFGCNELVDVTLPSDITEIPAYAFSNCIKLESIIIPSKVTTINDSAFSSAEALKNVTIQSLVLTSVGNNAFIGLPSGSVITLADSTLASLFVNNTNYEAAKTTIK